MRKEKEWEPRKSPRPRLHDRGSSVADCIKVVSIAEWERIKKSQPLAAYEGNSAQKLAA